MQHSLDCPKGGLIIRKYNEIRDCLGDMAALVWPQVREPVVREDDPASGDPGLHLDLGIRDTGCVAALGGGVVQYSCD